MSSSRPVASGTSPRHDGRWGGLSRTAGGPARRTGTDSTDVAVVGGGVIGSAIAWRLAQAGATVTVHDSADTGRASTVAAGMLAPASEAQLDNPELLRLSISSAIRWPEFAAELADPAGDAELTPDDHIGYRACGTLLVGMTAADQADIDRYRDLYDSESITAEAWDGERCRAAEPLLSHRVRAGLFAPDDHQVDPRRTLAALIAAGAERGVRRVTEPVADLSELTADRVVLAAGTWSGRLARLPIRPVHGQVIRLRAPDGVAVTRSIRAVNRGRSVYLVPRSNGEVVIGASSHEVGFDTAARAGDTFALLRDAIDVVPELGEYRLIETNVGLRPGTPDNAPLLGPIGDGRVVVATGHYRNGILLAPVTADLITRYLITGSEPERLRTFNAERFAS